MTEERSIPECIEVIQMVLLSLQDSRLPDIPYLDYALHSIKIIKKHFERVDAEHFSGKPEDAPPLENESFVAALESLHRVTGGGKDTKDFFAARSLMDILDNELSKRNAR